MPRINGPTSPPLLAALLPPLTVAATGFNPFSSASKPLSPRRQLADMTLSRSYDRRNQPGKSRQFAIQRRARCRSDEPSAQQETDRFDLHRERERESFENDPSKPLKDLRARHTYYHSRGSRGEEIVRSRRSVHQSELITMSGNWRLEKFAARRLVSRGLYGTGVMRYWSCGRDV